MDKNRRKFLKIIFIGSGVFLMENFLSPVFSRFLDDPVSKKSSASFDVVENKKVLSVFDSSGEEIFQIDKEV